MRRPRLLALLAASLTSGVAAPALAHINLLSPPARAAGVPDTYLLREPCGQARDRRVPEKVSVFRPGESIDVVWDVYQQHVSYFRISFDREGDDSFSSRASAPPDPAQDDLAALPAGEGEVILAYVEDPTGTTDHVEQRVTLPAEPCEECTLQVTQFTYGLPVREAVYYQCADLTLEGEAVAPAPPDAGAPSVAEPDDESSGGACSLAAGARRGALSLGWLAALLLLGARRRSAAMAASAAR